MAFARPTKRRRRRLSSPEAAAPDLRVERGDPRYPSGLEDLQENAPTHLFLRGSLPVLDAAPRVAIVGTRRATAYGSRVTRELSTALARAGACIVSGLATGVDGIAHQAALEVGGSTIAVLGTGLDVVFPKGHRDLQRRIGEVGVLVSELPHADHGMKFTFPKRNRIIAALSTLTIVVEAGERSGALSTARHALEIGRTIAAVPGPIDQPQSWGSNHLLRDGAVVIPSVEDALALVGLTPALRVPRMNPDGDEGRVWATLAAGGLDIESICHRSGLPAARCLAAVTTLELAGAVECALTGEVRRR